jgi:carbonic anhydrase
MAREHHSSTTETKLHRRHFLRTVIGSAGGVVLASSAIPHAALASGHTAALLLSCMDYRLVDEIERYMAGRGLRDKYDHVILAGASLGAVTDKFPSWGQTFWDHLKVAIDLHQIHKVIVLDHRDCGAYKVILGEDLAKDPKKETQVHAAQLNKLKKMIADKHPALEVELLMIDLAGKVEKV